jgi:hypothetical protein
MLAIFVSYQSKLLSSRQRLQYISTFKMFHWHWILCSTVRSFDSIAGKETLTLWRLLSQRLQINHVLLICLFSFLLTILSLLALVRSISDCILLWAFFTHLESQKTYTTHHVQPTIKCRYVWRSYRPICISGWFTAINITGELVIPSTKCTLFACVVYSLQSVRRACINTVWYRTLV